MRVKRQVGRGFKRQVGRERQVFLKFFQTLSYLAHARQPALCGYQPTFFLFLHRSWFIDISTCSIWKGWIWGGSQLLDPNSFDVQFEGGYCLVWVVWHYNGRVPMDNLRPTASGVSKARGRRLEMPKVEVRRRTWPLERLYEWNPKEVGS